MSEFGVRCTMANGEDVLITVPAGSADDALRQVRQHQRMFGPGDAAGNWLASKCDPAQTIVRVHDEVHGLDEDA